jgi:hypothetical protein
MVLQMTSQEAAIPDFKEKSQSLPENTEGNDETCTENVCFSGWDSNRVQPCHISTVIR